MAIEKNPLLSLVGGTSMPQPELDESELEIEIEAPDDEMTGIDAIAVEDELALQAAQDDHYANLAELIDPEDLAEISADVIDSYQADKESREEWESTFERGFDLLGLKLQETTAVSPLIIEAAVKFQSKASIELFPSGGPVRTQIVGNADQEREDQATRVQDFMNYQFTEQISEYFDEFEKMLFHLPLIGSAFKKMYYDPTLRRPCSEFIPIDQFYVSYYASDIQKAERYTQVIHRSITEMERDVQGGMYMDVGLEDPTTPDPTSFTSKIDSIMGISPADDFDQQYVLLEQHCYLDLPEPFNSEDGVALPYVVTVEKESKEIIALRRNWSKEDITKEKQTYFTHYKFVPGFGFYGLGLIHLLGNMTMSATSALRSLVDAGQFSNLPGGFKARGVRIVGNNDPIAPGEFREVESTGLDLQKSIVPLPYKEPSQTLYNMLTFMTGAGQKFADSTEQIVNESSNYGPVGTTMALIESSAKFFSAIHKRLHKSQRDEFRILSKINFEFLPDEYPYDVPNITTSVFKSDFDGRVDVIPVSDPNIPSAAHRLSMAQMVLQLSSQAPQGMYNLQQVHLSILKAANIQNPDRFFTPKNPPEPHDPITDIDLVVKGMPIQAFPQQDHAAHIAIKTAFIDDPTLGKTEMMAPAVPVLQANIQQHMVMQYQEQMSGLMKTETPPGEVSPEVLSQLSINAAEQILEANMGTASEDSLENQNLLLESARLDLDQQKLQMTATKDAAELSIKNRELDLKEMGVQLDAAEKVSESEQKKMDARIRDDNSIRTTNAKLTIESLKNLAKERDLMIDKRMNEKRYASGGTVNLAQGGEFFEEFLRGRGGRDAFQEGDFLEGLLAKIGGGRTRTQDEMISDTYESYKLDLRDSDSLDDNLKYQAIIEDEEKRKSKTPTVDSKLEDLSMVETEVDVLGTPDANAETFVPEGSVDLEDNYEQVDVEGDTPEVDIGIGTVDKSLEQMGESFSTPKPIEYTEDQIKVMMDEGFPKKEEPKTLLQKMKPQDNDGPRPVPKSLKSLDLAKKIENSLAQAPTDVENKSVTGSVRPPVDPIKTTEQPDFKPAPKGPNVRLPKTKSTAPDIEMAPAPVVPPREATLKEVDESFSTPIEPSRTYINPQSSITVEEGSFPEGQDIGVGNFEESMIDKAARIYAETSILPDWLDRDDTPKPKSSKEGNFLDRTKSYIKQEEGTYEQYGEKFLGNWRKDKTNKGKEVGEVIGTGLNKRGLSPRQIAEINKEIKQKGFLSKKTNDKIFNQIVTKLQKDFRKDMKGSNVTFGKLNPARKAALIAMGSQLGFSKTTGRGENSFKKMYEAIKNGDFNEAAKQVLTNSTGDGPSQFSLDTPQRAGRVALMLREGKFQRGYGL